MTDRELLELIATQVGKLTVDVEEIKVLLPTLATKEELATLATKEELATLATKEELSALATKEDLTALATKEELATLATKKDLAALAAKVELVDLTTKEELTGVKSEIDSLKSIVIRIENDHGQKLGALLNGYKQNAERLDRVEAKLAEHDEILMKKF